MHSRAEDPENPLREYAIVVTDRNRGIAKIVAAHTPFAQHGMRGRQPQRSIA